MLLALEQELRSGAAVADEDRSLVEQVKEDLEAVLERGAAPAAAADEDASPRERLEQAIERFEADHPSLANLMSAALDALNKLGV